MRLQAISGTRTPCQTLVTPRSWSVILFLYLFALLFSLNPCSSSLNPRKIVFYQAFKRITANDGDGSNVAPINPGLYTDASDPSLFPECVKHVKESIQKCVHATKKVRWNQVWHNTRNSWRTTWNERHIDLSSSNMPSRVEQQIEPISKVNTIIQGESWGSWFQWKIAKWTTYAIRPILQYKIRNAIAKGKQEIMEEGPDLFRDIWRNALKDPYFSSALPSHPHSASSQTSPSLFTKPYRFLEEARGVLDKLRNRHQVVFQRFFDDLDSLSSHYVTWAEKRYTEAALHALECYITGDPIDSKFFKTRVPVSLPTSSQTIITSSQIKTDSSDSHLQRWTKDQARLLHAYTLREIDTVSHEVFTLYRPECMRFLHRQSRLALRSMFDEEFLNQHPLTSHVVDSIAAGFVNVVTPALMVYADWKEQQVVEEFSDDLWKILDESVNKVNHLESNIKGFASALNPFNQLSLPIAKAIQLEKSKIASYGSLKRLSNIPQIISTDKKAANQNGHIVGGMVFRNYPYYPWEDNLAVKNNSRSAYSGPMHVSWKDKTIFE